MRAEVFGQGSPVSFRSELERVPNQMQHTAIEGSVLPIGHVAQHPVKQPCRVAVILEIVSRLTSVP